MKKIKQRISELEQKYPAILYGAVRFVVYEGKSPLSELTDDDVKRNRDEINARHDKAEKEGKLLAMTRDFELMYLDAVIEVTQLDDDTFIALVKKCLL